MSIDENAKKAKDSEFFAKKRRERLRNKIAEIRSLKKSSLGKKLFFVFGLPISGGLLILYLMLTGRIGFDVDFFVSSVAQVFVVGLLAGVAFCMLFLRIKKGKQIKFGNKILLWILFFASLWAILLIVLPENIKEELIKIFLRCTESISELI